MCVVQKRGGNAAAGELRVLCRDGSEQVRVDAELKGALRPMLTYLHGIQRGEQPVQIRSINLQVDRRGFASSKERRRGGRQQALTARIEVTWASGES